MSAGQLTLFTEIDEQCTEEDDDGKDLCPVHHCVLCPDCGNCEQCKPGFCYVLHWS